MNILKYTYKGQACPNDIHYEQDDVLCRMGTFEERPESLKQAHTDLENYTSEITQIDDFKIKRLEFGEKDGTHRCKIEGYAFTKQGEPMKVILPNIEWSVNYGYDEIAGEETRHIRPLNQIDSAVINSILKMVAALEHFAAIGTSQIQMDFSEQKEAVL